MLYDTIKKLADKEGITIKQMEDELGISNGTMFKWNKAAPSAFSLYKVAKRLNTTVEELLKEEVEKEEN